MPMRIEDIFFGTQMRGWIAMAGEAPAHVERLSFPCERHVADRTMTFGASDAFCDVDAVVEVDIVRECVDSGPADRLVLRQALPVMTQHRRIGPDLRMAGHADGR